MTVAEMTPPAAPEASEQLPPPVAATHEAGGAWTLPWHARWVPRIAPKYRRPLAWLLAAVLAFGGMASWTLRTLTRDLPDVSVLRHYQPQQITEIRDRHGTFIGEIFEERRSVISMDAIPRSLILSILAAEDADFYEHGGIDLPGLARAAYHSLREGEATQGASTITQQVVKNLLLSPERTLLRKAKELILARRVERTLSKDEILHVYLNHINFGHGRHGAQEAARFYFNKDASKLTLAEASLLAGIPQAPARLSPIEHPEAAQRRQQFVLSQLEVKREEHWPDLPLAQIREARQRPPKLVPFQNRARLAPEIVAHVREELIRAVGEEAALHGGFQVHTSLDMRLQQEARTTLRKGLEEYDARHELRAPFRRSRRLSDAELAKLRDQARVPQGGTRLSWSRTYPGVVLSTQPESDVLVLAAEGERVHLPLRSLARYNPEQLPLSDVAEVGATIEVGLARPRTGQPALVSAKLGPEGAICVLDAHTREVLALVGGYNVNSGFNRATQAMRQPGSTFKPLVYAVGIQSREFTPATLVTDRTHAFENGWMPSNMGATSESGRVRLRVGLAESINLVAVHVIEQVGPESVASFAHDLGITAELPAQLGLSLGISEVRVDELTNAYATFPDQGRYRPMRHVLRLVGPDGKDVPLLRAQEHEALTPAEAYVMTDMLTSVVRHGTATRARRLTHPVAGKTGTSDEARDTWFMGFTPDRVAGVWVGYDDHRPLGDGEGGQQTALPIWVEAMQTATEGLPESKFEVPPGILRASIDPESGLRTDPQAQGAMREVFLEGTLPRRAAAFDLIRQPEPIPEFTQTQQP